MSAARMNGTDERKAKLPPIHKTLLSNFYRDGWCGDGTTVTPEERLLWVETVRRGTVFPVDLLKGEWHHMIDLALRKPEGDCCCPLPRVCYKREFVMAMAVRLRTRDSMYLATGCLLQILGQRKIDNAAERSDIKLQNEWEEKYFAHDSQVDVAYTHQPPDHVPRVIYGTAKICHRYFGQHQKSEYDLWGINLKISNQWWVSKFVVAFNFGPEFSLDHAGNVMNELLEQHFPKWVTSIIRDYAPLFYFPDIESALLSWRNSGDDFTTFNSTKTGICAFAREGRANSWKAAHNAPFKLLYNSATQWYYDIRRLIPLLTNTLPLQSTIGVGFEGQGKGVVAAAAGVVGVVDGAASSSNRSGNNNSSSSSSTLPIKSNPTFSNGDSNKSPGGCSSSSSSSSSSNNLPLKSNPTFSNGSGNKSPGGCSGSGNKSPGGCSSSGNIGRGSGDKSPGGCGLVGSGGWDGGGDLSVPVRWTRRIQTPTDWDAPYCLNFDFNLAQIILAYCWGEELCPPIKTPQKWINQFGAKSDQLHAKKLSKLASEKQLIDRQLLKASNKRKSNRSKVDDDDDDEEEEEEEEGEREGARPRKKPKNTKPRTPSSASHAVSSSSRS